MSFEDYLAIDADSNSANKLIRQSPAHYKYREEEDYDTRAKQIGSAIHCALLEPERFSSYYLVAEADVRTDAHYKGLAKDVGGHRVLTRPEHRRVLNMQASAYRNKRFAGYMKRMGRNELTVISTDPVTGVPVKVRFDRMGDSPWALDIKKCQDARADEFIRAISNYGYYMQVAFYRDVWFWETGEHLEEFPLVAIEEKAPHGVICHDLDDIAIMLGRKHYREALDTYARCREKGEWPSYEEESEVVSVTSWLADELFAEVQA
jgi:exodeoxyribonuclease VIII